MSDDARRKGRAPSGPGPGTVPKTEPWPALDRGRPQGGRLAKRSDDVTSPFIVAEDTLQGDPDGLEGSDGLRPGGSETLGGRTSDAGTAGWDPEISGAARPGEKSGDDARRDTFASADPLSGTVIVPESSIVPPDDERVPPIERTMIAEGWDVDGARPTVVDPWGEDGASLGDPDEDSDVSDVSDVARIPDAFSPPDDEKTEAGDGSASSDHTVMLDPEMQDRLMALRAQQDAELRQRFGGDVAVMFTDLVGSTAYYEKHGDLMGRQKMLTHNALLFPIIRGRNGTIIKTIGDAIMCCFTSVDEGLTAAEEMQQSLRAFNQSCQTPDDEIHIRIGINSGHAIAEDGDLHGDAVNVAARVQAKANGDEILVSEAVKKAAGRGTFEDQGRVQFKGKAEKVNVYRLVWDEAAAQRKSDEPLLAGRYKLGAAIGRGPVGVVYAAEDQQLRQSVAVKRLHEFVTHDPESMEAFRERFVSMASLRHDGIVRVSDFSTDAEEPFYVMDRIEGEDLAASVSRQGATDPERAVRVVLDVGRALQYAHEHGVIHGNIKPENILLRASDGRALLLDFGTAAVHQVQGTRTGRSVASPAFMAPEQVSAVRPTAPTDVYGLGAVLYFMLAGRPPFEPAATLEAMRAVAAGQHKALSVARRGLPQKLVEIVERAMATKPEKRFAAIKDLIKALEEQQGRDRGRRKVADPIRPQKAPAPEKPVKEKAKEKEEAPARRKSEPEVRNLRRALIGVSMLAVVTLGAVVVLGVLLLNRGQTTVTETTVEAAPAVADAAVAPRPATAPVAGEAAEGEENTEAVDPEAATGDDELTPTGRLSIITAPHQADVFIDGVKVGRTPRFKEVVLTEGPHTLRIVHPKLRVFTETVEIPSGELVRRRIKLKAR